MSVQRSARLLCRPVRRFAAADSGVAAVEFAMILPVLIVMFFAVTELTSAYDARTKVTRVASSAADLTAQEKAVCATEMDDIFKAMDPIMFPFATTEPNPADPLHPKPLVTVVVSSLIDAGDGTAKVGWSDSNVDTAKLTVGAPHSIPDGLLAEDGSVILAEVTYTYKPTLKFFLREPIVPEPVTMTDRFYLHPRKVQQIEMENSCS